MPMNYVGAAGDTYNSQTTLPLIEKTIDSLSRRDSIFGGLGMDTEGRDRLVKTVDIGGQSRDIASTSVVQIKDIDVGDEARFTLQDDFGGKPTHGAAPVLPGNYPEFYHDKVRLNMATSPEYPFWSEMDQQRFGNMISNMEENYQKNIAHYMAEWTDFFGLQALLHGGDQGVLSSKANGGLAMQLMNAANPGDPISCKNTYVAGSGLVSWSATRATYEASVGHAIYGLTDVSGDFMSLLQHEIIHNILVSNLRFKVAEAFGMQLTAVCLADPWVVKRLLSRNSNNTWYTLMKDADIRGPKNHAIDHHQTVIIDKIMYIPCDWLRAFRATGSDNAQPTYGAGITGDPKVKILTADTDSKKCCAIYMGAKALLCARSTKVYGAGTNAKKGGRVWFTPRFGEHGMGGGWCAHTKIGFKRYEPETKNDGTAAYLNNQTLVAWFYDAGPGVAPAA